MTYGGDAKRPFPPIRAVMMLSGGSYFCYTGPDAYGNAPAPAPTPAFSSICGNQTYVGEAVGAVNLQCSTCPPIFAGKTQDEIQGLIGCCPEGRIEARYENSEAVKQHPPVILCQTYNDSDADNNASAAYFMALRSHLRRQSVSPELIDAGVKIVRTCWSGDKCSGKKLAAPRNANISATECSPHTWFPEMILPVTEFLVAITDIEDDTPFFQLPTTKIPKGLPENVLNCTSPPSPTPTPTPGSSSGKSR